MDLLLLVDELGNLRHLFFDVPDLPLFVYCYQSLHAGLLAALAPRVILLIINHL